MRSKVDNRAEGKFWADKLMDLANLSFVALALSQFVTEKLYWPGVIIGGILYLSLLALAIFIKRR